MESMRVVINWINTRKKIEVAWGRWYTEEGKSVVVDNDS